MKEKKAFNRLNLSVFLHFVGRQAYSIFVPVILLKNGYSLALVLGFLTLSSLVTIISSYLGQSLMKGRKVIYFNFIAIISEISFLLLLTLQGFSPIVFLLLVIFEGFYYAFYYLSYYAITVHYTSKEKTGNNLGNLTISTALAAIIGPLLGSYVLGGSKLYLIATAISALLLSLIPLLKITREEVDRPRTQNIKLSEIKKQLFNYGVMSSFEVIIFVLWSIYAYISNFTLLSIGLIAVATSTARIVLSFSIKTRLVNKNFRNGVMALSVIGIAITSVYRYKFPQKIILTNFMMSLFYVGYQLGAQTAIINQFKGNRTFYSSMLLQTTTFSIRIPIYLIAFIIGLNSIILLPVAIGTIYFIFNIRETLEITQSIFNTSRKLLRKTNHINYIS